MPESAHLPLKAGIIGCGGIAQIIHLPILQGQEDLLLEAICDIDSRKVSIIADRYGIPNVYVDIEEMFNNHSLDVVFIFTPNNLHLPMALLALKNGCHVFLERPAARSAEETRRIANAAKKYNRAVMVGMQNRFQPDVQAIKTFVSSREIGEIFYVRGGWLQATLQVIKQPWIFNKNVSGGGVLMDLGIQLIDLVWWLMDKPRLESIKAETVQIKEKIGVEDFCSLSMRFSNGVVVLAEVSWDFPITKDRFYLEIFGKQGSCNLNPLKIQKLWHGQILNITPESKETTSTLFKKAYENEITHFLKFLMGKTGELESSIFDAVQVMEMIDCAYQSLTEKREICLQHERK